MSTLVFSDTHFTKKFDQKLFNKLSGLIKSADQVIIDGDFWEGLTISFDEFLKTRWNQLFPLLKAKKAVYIYGNHDNFQLSDKRISEFCDQMVDHYVLKKPNQTYYFTHGHNFLMPVQPEKDFDPMRRTKLWYQIFIRFSDKIQDLAFRIMGANIFPEKFNNMTLEQRKSIAPINNLLVCGHSHKPQYNPELNFMDIGFFNYGWANYMLIDDEGNFEFKSERY